MCWTIFRWVIFSLLYFSSHLNLDLHVNKWAFDVTIIRSCISARSICHYIFALLIASQFCCLSWPLFFLSFFFWQNWFFSLFKIYRFFPSRLVKFRFVSVCVSWCAADFDNGHRVDAIHHHHNPQKKKSYLTIINARTSIKSLKRLIIPIGIG